MISKTIKTALLMLVFATVIVAAQVKITESKIKTSAECEKCKARIEKAVNSMEGVQSSDLEVESKVITVKYDSSKISLDKIKGKISETGYNADEVISDKRAYKRLPKCCQVGGHKSE